MRENAIEWQLVNETKHIIEFKEAGVQRITNGRTHVKSA